MPKPNAQLEPAQPRHITNENEIEPRSSSVERNQTCKDVSAGNLLKFLNKTV